jgi:transcriptional regulator with XRE-family HTH domain
MRSTTNNSQKTSERPQPTSLAIYRRALGLRQSDLAEASKVSRVGISNLERRINRPRPQTAERIAAALNASVAKVFPDGEVTD